MLLLCWFAFYYLNSGAAVESVLPYLGALVLGAQRILPILQKGYAGWTQMNGERNSLEDIVEILAGLKLT